MNDRGPTDGSAGGGLSSPARSTGGYSASPNDIGRRLAVIYARLLLLAENRREVEQAESSSLSEAVAPADGRGLVNAANESGSSEIVEPVTEQQLHQGVTPCVD
jgi:hypothetical protein